MLTVPLTVPKLQERVPPGAEVEGVVQVAPAGLVLTTETNCILSGRVSTRVKLSTVWPGAISAVTVYCRGKLGPLAVSSSETL